jgi:hypothetical protein
MDSATFLAAYPEFDAITPAVIDAEIVKDDKILNPTAWGDMRDTALMLVVAHRLTLRFRMDKDNVLPQNMPGAVTSLDANNGGITVSTEAISSPDSSNIEKDFSRTNYGVEYLTLLHSVIPPGMLV